MQIYSVHHRDTVTFFNPDIQPASFYLYLTMFEQLIENFMNLLSIKTGQVFHSLGIKTFFGILDYNQNT